MLKSEFAVKKVIKISIISLESHCITAISQIDELDSRNCNYLKSEKKKREKKRKIDIFELEVDLEKEEFLKGFLRV